MDGNQNITGDPVSLVLQVDNLPAMFLDIVTPGQEPLQRFRTCHDDAGMPVEKVEEAILPRHQGLKPVEQPHDDLPNFSLTGQRI